MIENDQRLRQRSLDQATEDDSHDDRRGPEAVALENVSHESRYDHDPHVHHGLIQSVGAYHAEREHRGPEKRPRYQADPRKDLGAEQTDHEEQDVGQQHGEENPVEQARLLLEQVRARPQSLHLKPSEYDRRRSAAGNTQRKRGYHGAAGRRVVGGLRSGNAFDTALAEFLGRLRPPLGLVVADHRRHGAALGRQHTDKDADTAGTQNGTAHPAKVFARRQAHHRHGGNDVFPAQVARLVEQFRDREKPDQDGDELHPFKELRHPEGESIHPCGQVDAHGRDEQPETTADEVLDGRLRADGCQHRQGEHAQREVFRRTEAVGDARQQRRSQEEDQHADDAAAHRGYGCNAQRAACLSLLCHGISVECRRHGRRRPRRVDQDRRDGTAECPGAVQRR